MILGTLVILKVLSTIMVSLFLALIKLVLFIFIALLKLILFILTKPFILLGLFLKILFLKFIFNKGEGI